MFQNCPQCGQETLFTREAVYDGFTKTGEALICSVCGSVAEERAAPREKADPLAALFGDGARETGPDLFDVASETAKSCRKCRHYVLHPFTQRCGLHDREVSATDCCSRFEPAGS